LARELEERELELASREAELEKRAAELDEWAAALEQRASALDRDSALLAGERVRLRRILETGVTAPDTDVVIDTSTKQANALGISSSAVTRRLSRLDLSPFPNIATAREVGGQTIVATLIDGKAVRITARRDWVNDIFSSQYETAEPGSLSWVESHDYRTCTSPTVTGLLAAALKEVDLGPHRDEFAGEILGDPSDGGAEYEHMSPPIVDATAEDSRPSAGKPRRRFWKPRRG
jgi:hypothetical protein